MCVFWLKVITVSALARTARSVPCHNFHSRNTPRWNFFRDVFIDQRSRKVDPRAQDKAQDVAIVFGLLLFWSWYVRHSIVYIDLNQSLGFGHATRVSAFARHLLSLEESHTVYIVSSAPKRVFATAIALGAIYRSAEIDPVILQPLASVASRTFRLHS